MRIRNIYLNKRCALSQILQQANQLTVSELAFS